MKYTRSNNCSSGGGEVAVMEVAPAAVDNSASTKRRKVGNGELRLSSSKSVKITDRDGEDVIINTSKKFADEMSVSSGDAPASCCSSNESVTEKLKCSDLKDSAEIETPFKHNLDRRESTPTNKMESPTTAKPPAIIESRHTIPPEKTPPAAELEEFFANAEKDLQKSFKDKYNYDIVNDITLKGRFEWTEVKK